MTITAPLHVDGANGGGSGNSISVSATGPVVVRRIPLTANGGNGGGDGGDITIATHENVTIEGDLGVRGDGDSALGGHVTITADPHGTLTVSGTLDAGTSRTSAVGAARKFLPIG